MTPPVEVVRLTWAEVNFAASVGILRQITNLRDGRKDAHGFDGSPFQVHIMGCIGEMAVAKFFYLYWAGSLGNLGVADVGLLQVRATEHMNGRLILHPPDDPNAVWVGVRVKLPDVYLSGWMYGHEAKDSRYWTAPESHPNRPAFFVANDDLRSMADLKALGITLIR